MMKRRYDSTVARIAGNISDSAHRGINQQGCGDMAIPARAIVRMIDLAEVAEPALSN